MTINPYLFSCDPIQVFINRYKASLSDDINGLRPDMLHGKSEKDLINELFNKHTFEVPILQPDGRSIVDDGSVQFDVDFPIEVYSVPFEGIAELFMYRPTSRSNRVPIGNVRESEILIVRQADDTDETEIQSKLDEKVELIEQYLEYTKSDCGRWKDEAYRITTRGIEELKRRS